jgi:hypothetical protein
MKIRLFPFCRLLLGLVISIGAAACSCEWMGGCGAGSASSPSGAPSTVASATILAPSSSGSATPEPFAGLPYTLTLPDGWSGWTPSDLQQIKDSVVGDPLDCGLSGRHQSCPQCRRVGGLAAQRQSDRDVRC